MEHMNERKGSGMALNRLEWTQKDQMITYHVLKWPTSHLHPRTRTSGSADFELKEQAGAAGASDNRDLLQESIGPGVSERSCNSRWRSGGLGQHGTIQEGLRDAANDRDGLTLSTHQAGLQVSGTAQEAASAVVQNNSVQVAASQMIFPDVTRNLVHAYGVEHMVRKTGSRIREMIGRLRDNYLRQQKKAEPHRKQGHAAQRQKDRQGTRQASREEVLSMQAENHYLLDSYDKNGQYSTLGKGNR